MLSIFCDDGDHDCDDHARDGGDWAGAGETHGSEDGTGTVVEASDVELAAEDESFLFGDAGIELYGSISNPFELGQL